MRWLKANEVHGRSALVFVGAWGDVRETPEVEEGVDRVKNLRDKKWEGQKKGGLHAGSVVAAIAGWLR